jgi:rsbT co-antagonist protein RsbR
LDRGRSQAAVVIIYSGLLLSSLAAVVLAPELLPLLIVVPILAMMVALPFVSARAIRDLSIIVSIQSCSMVAVARFVHVSAPLPPLIANIALLLVVPVVGLILFLLWQYKDRLTATLSQLRSTNNVLGDLQTNLAMQVAERTAALRTALAEVEARAAEQARLIEENAQQRDVIRELGVPVLPVSDDTLIMPLVGALDTTRLDDMRQHALREVERLAARHLLIDITGVPVIDSQVAQGLLTVVQAARLVGAEVTLVGIRPEVAQAIVGLGLDLRAMQTYSDLRSALRRARSDERRTTKDES